jgi:LuxR family transcriptional regulator, maltose regulon positive regulatory protein
MTAGSVPSKPLPVPLLATRFFLPSLPAACVSRPRLLQRMAAALTVPLTLVSASAGFGKSFLVSEWIRSQPGLRAGWLTLEASDNEWGQFFRYLVAAWQQIFPQAGSAVLAEFGSSPSPNTEVLISTLLNDLAGSQQPEGAVDALVVLDDYHCINTSSIHESIMYLVEHLPPRCHLLLITRADPPLPLARWRSRGQMVEVRVVDLCFNPDEALDFLNRVMHLNLSNEQVQVLEARTEGWIAGLQMAALSLQGRDDTQTFINAFGGSHRYVLDYLVEEVVSQQTEEIKQFLLTTSVLEQFCGPLCDALLGAAEPISQTILERLERANLFMIPLDDQRIWFRYHHLFAGLLRVRLRQISPERIPTLHRRAAEWFAEKGLWREAIHYALQARDFEYGADLIDRAVSSSGLDFFFSGMRSLIEPFPLDLMQRRPLLKLARAFSMIETSQLSGIKPLLRSVESQLKEMERAHGKLELLGMNYVAQSIAASLLGDSAWILEASHQVIRFQPDHVKANVNALIQLGNVYFFEGDLHKIASYWQQALDLSLKNNYPFGILCCLDDLGRLCCYRGEFNRAEAHFQHALKLLDEEQPRSLRWLGAVYRDYADLLRERNRLTDAHAMMTSSLELIEKWETVSGWGLGCLHMGHILLADGDRAGAAAMLQKTEILCQSYTVYPDLATFLELFRARLNLEAGDLDMAMGIIQACMQQAHGGIQLERDWAASAFPRCFSRDCERSPHSRSTDLRFVCMYSELTSIQALHTHAGSGKSTAGVVSACAPLLFSLHQDANMPLHA